MTRAEFMFMLHDYMMEHRGQRKGQAVWNLLESYFPVEVDKVRATEIDPFYNDANITAFLNYFGIN